MNWEERKAAYTAKAKILADVPKDLKYFSNKISIIPIGIDKSKLILELVQINQTKK